MARPFVYGFEWDPRKAQSNAKKHGIAFDRAAAVFLDPRALTEFDSVHSHDEDRWVTLGMDGAGILLVVCHTFTERGSRTAAFASSPRARPRGKKRPSMEGHELMKREYDFSKGVRGKFYRKGAVLRLPIYLDTDLQRQLERLAAERGKAIGEVVNLLLRKDIELLRDLA